MTVSLIVAMGRDLVLGAAEGGIPWDLPRDREHFRAYTAGKWLLLGRLTYQEMDGWFGDRRPIVLSRASGWRPAPPGHRVSSSLPQAIKLAACEGAAELVVCGGASVYAAALPFADRLVLTEIEWGEGRDENSLCFPDWQRRGAWREISRETWPADAQNPHAATMRILERGTASGAS
jgi:dihydrofolate reductase